MSLGLSTHDDNDNDADDNDAEWHTMDNLWLHRLLGINAKWADK